MTTKQHITLATAITVLVVAVAHFIPRDATQPPSRVSLHQSILGLNESEIQARFGEPIFNVDKGEGKRAMAYDVNIENRVTPIVIYLNKDGRACHVSSEGIPLR